MTSFLLKLAKKDQTDYSNRQVRFRIGCLASIVGIAINVILSIMKLIIGFTISSIGVIADAFNNISDTTSSVITLIGFKIADMPSDKEHPYGHARAEHISALIVALMVLLVGLQFIKVSLDRIINPRIVKFEILSFSILVVSILFKVWLCYFNRVLGNKINSAPLKATATDAAGDVLTTSVVALSLIIGRYTSLPVDGFVGLIVALLIIYSGYQLIRESISSLIGEAPPKKLVKSIYNDILTYDYIAGAHDLLIYTYGVGRTMATIDVEVPSNMDLVTIHDVVDMAERELGEKYNMTLVIHVDPLGPDSGKEYELRKTVNRIVKENPKVKSMHDFVILDEKNGKDIIEFHLVIDGNMMNNKTTASIKSKMEQLVEYELTDTVCHIIIDVEY